MCEPNKIKKNTHPKRITALVVTALFSSRVGGGYEVIGYGDRCDCGNHIDINLGERAAIPEPKKSVLDVVQGTMNTKKFGMKWKKKARAQAEDRAAVEAETAHANAEGVIDKIVKTVHTKKAASIWKKNARAKVEARAADEDAEAAAEVAHANAEGVIDKIVKTVHTKKVANVWKQNARAKVEAREANEDAEAAAETAHANAEGVIDTIVETVHTKKVANVWKQNARAKVEAREADEDAEAANAEGVIDKIVIAANTKKAASIWKQNARAKVEAHEVDEDAEPDPAAMRTWVPQQQTRRSSSMNDDDGHMANGGIEGIVNAKRAGKKWKKKVLDNGEEVEVEATDDESVEEVEEVVEQNDEFIIPDAEPGEKKKKRKKRKKDANAALVSLTAFQNMPAVAAPLEVVDELPISSDEDATRGPRKALEKPKKEKRRLRPMQKRRSSLIERDAPTEIKRAPPKKANDFLSQFCIIDATTKEYYQKIFDAVDDNDSGGLSEDELTRGLKAINKAQMSINETKYMYYALDMMELVGVDISTNESAAKPQVSFDQFCCIAALSEKIIGLTEEARAAIEDTDFSLMENKMVRAKELFSLECNEWGEFDIDKIQIILKAGRIAEVHEKEVLDRLRRDGQNYLNFFDFLSHVPLFVDIHQDIVDKPMHMTKREKVSFKTVAKLAAGAARTVSSDVKEGLKDKEKRDAQAAAAAQ